MGLAKANSEGLVGSELRMEAQQAFSGSTDELDWNPCLWGYRVPLGPSLSPTAQLPESWPWK